MDEYWPWFQLSMQLMNKETMRMFMDIIISFEPQVRLTLIRTNNQPLLNYFSKNDRLLVSTPFQKYEISQRYTARFSKQPPQTKTTSNSKFSIRVHKHIGARRQKARFAIIWQNIYFRFTYQINFQY